MKAEPLIGLRVKHFKVKGKGAAGLGINERSSFMSYLNLIYSMSKMFGDFCVSWTGPWVKKGMKLTEFWHL